jgi:signal transduction histidine kinase
MRIRTEYGCDVHAVADRGALRQMVLNLLDNAVKYGPQGQTVQVRLEPDGPNVRLTVTDEGPGVAVAERDLVWSPFQRGSHTGMRLRPSRCSGWRRNTCSPFCASISS